MAKITRATVGQSAVRVAASVLAGAAFKSLGPNTIWIGTTASVTSSTGWQLASGEFLPFAGVEALTDFYAISDGSGNSELQVWAA